MDFKKYQSKDDIYKNRPIEKDQIDRIRQKSTRGQNEQKSTKIDQNRACQNWTLKII